jgi:hypothetical protein
MSKDEFIPDDWVFVPGIECPNCGTFFLEAAALDENELPIGKVHCASCGYRAAHASDVQEEKPGVHHSGYYQNDEGDVFHVLGHNMSDETIHAIGEVAKAARKMVESKPVARLTMGSRVQLGERVGIVTGLTHEPPRGIRYTIRFDWSGAGEPEQADALEDALAVFDDAPNLAAKASDFQADQRVFYRDWIYDRFAWVPVTVMRASGQRVQIYSEREGRLKYVEPRSLRAMEKS